MPGSGGTLLASLTVHCFSQQVGVTIVTGVLLDHVQHDPPQVGTLPGGPWLGSQRVETAATEHVGGSGA